MIKDSVDAAGDALAAHQAHRNSQGDSMEKVVTDLLTDLRHYCTATGIEFGECDDLASHHHDKDVRNGER